MAENAMYTVLIDILRKFIISKSSAGWEKLITEVITEVFCI